MTNRELINKLNKATGPVYAALMHSTDPQYVQIVKADFIRLLTRKDQDWLSGFTMEKQNGTWYIDNDQDFERKAAALEGGYNVSES